MNKLTVRTFFIVAISATLLTGFGLGDITKSDKKDIIKAVVILVAAKIIADMIIDYKTEQVESEDEVIKAYKAKHNNMLPKENKLETYTTALSPGKVVKAGTGMKVASDMTVIPSEANKGKIFVKERIVIYDNDGKNNPIRTLIKSVETKSKAGRYKNEFNFKLPKNLPEGVYPIKTQVIVNGKEFSPNKKTMQLVLKVDHNHQFQIVALNGE